MTPCRACKVAPEDECSSECLLRPAFLLTLRQTAEHCSRTGSLFKMTADEALYLLDLIDALEASDGH